jgi:predicted MFS family arabinose efflux permease
VSRPSVARDRDFRLVLTAWGLSALGDFLAVVALTLRIQENTGSGLAVSALLIAAALPVVLLNPLGGWLVDRFETRWVLAAVAAAQAVVAVALGLVESTAATIALVFVLNAGLTVERPALFALIPRIVGDEQAPRAYAWFEGVKYATVTLGFALGGVLTGAFGSGTALLVDAGTFAVTAVVALALRTRRVPVARGQREAHAMTAGLRLVGRDVILRAMVLVLGASILFGGIDNVANVFFAKDSLDAGDAGYGILAAAWGVGMIGGATAAGRRVAARSAATAIVGAVAIMGAAIALVSISPVLAVAVVFMVAGGLGNGLSNVAMRVLLQARVADALRGRVYSAYQGALTVADFLALAAGGVLVELIGPRETLAVAGIGCLAAALVGLPALRSRQSVSG